MANTVAELVFIPAPGVGHIMSTVEMAKLLVSRDPRLSITVLVIDPPYSSSMALTTYIDSLGKYAIEQIRFIRLPQDQTSPKLDPNAPMTSLYEFINNHRKYVRNIISDNIDRRRVVGFVVDVFCTGMIDVADELNIPTYVFFTSNAAFLGFNLFMESLWVDKNQDHVLELINSGGEIPVPSFVTPVPTKVFPLVYRVRDGLDFLMSSIGKMRRAKGVMVNTFLELETYAIKSFPGTNFTQVYPVGPILNLDGVAGKPEDKDVFSWLDAQPPSSVVVLCFGSFGSFEEVQVKEIAYGLERSGYRFVWSLRRPPQPYESVEAFSDDDYVVVLPDGFLDRTKGVGKVIGWAPQVSLLAHEAVGGFVSHCGWNSMLESLWFGVPTATWPIYSEQQINAFEMVVELGLAVDLKLDYGVNVFNPEGDTIIVTAEEIETGIRLVMEDNEVRAKVKNMSRETVTSGGSSYASVGCVVDRIFHE